MAKPNRKLALRRESLRNLSAAELGQVGGGTNLYVVDAYYNYEWVIMRGPRGTTSRTDGSFAYNMYQW